MLSHHSGNRVHFTGQILQNTFQRMLQDRFYILQDRFCKHISIYLCGRSERCGPLVLQDNGATVPVAGTVREVVAEMRTVD